MNQPFTEKVRQQIERFQKQDFLTLEAEVTRKRIAWIRQNRLYGSDHNPISPRQAFDLLFFEYMGLPTEDLPVVLETDQQITWLSKNKCPTLDACKALNLDTRLVCRAVFEAPTQAFLSELDPQLKFMRSYVEIRPYSAYCQESILRERPDTANLLFSLIILPFQPEDQAEVKRLILSGLGDHWGIIDPSKNPDLDDIATTYTGATFLVARWQNQIVGTGSLVPRPEGKAEVVRMSVAIDMRRKGIGRLILDQLVLRARAAGFRQVILETTSTWLEVIEFYLRYGFHITHYQDGDVYFALILDR
jgi:putative acetyltransferase